MWEAIWLATAFGAGIFAAWLVLRTMPRAVATGRTRSGDPPKCSCESRVRTLEADLTELQELLKRMDARDRMRRVRAAKDQVDEEPDPFKDPVGWKLYMRRQKALGGS